MKNDAISFSVIKRLPRYYRFLGELKANGIIRISSKELSQRMGLTASQIMQEFQLLRAVSDSRDTVITLNSFIGKSAQFSGYTAATRP